ncbi:hypothetical protein PC113_g14946 [Phytophthora cactorum]|uniref:Uncharacterized protein n=1 Tax=Phytophthora cactorum TaxID=29920 RepID=A0A8T1B8E8_9STRA|nr:hypothetical protein PC111_g16102 [Phytophthora cactorum]KAG2852533.1 hypothetical protein PC113_g14946 [Phytophthora cactorum]KAG2898525.1 hypothetical protein PC115_g16827 [Phytophthora cactorum]
MRGKCPLRWLNDLNEHSIASMRQHVGQWKSQIYHSGDDVASFFQMTTSRADVNLAKQLKIIVQSFFDGR